MYHVAAITVSFKRSTYPAKSKRVNVCLKIKGKLDMPVTVVVHPQKPESVKGSYIPLK